MSDDIFFTEDTVKIILWCFGFGVPMTVLISCLVYKVVKRRGLAKKKEVKTEAKPVPCPICGKPMNGNTKRMPSITKEPKEYTVGDCGKWVKHWEITESEVEACVICATLAWDDCRLKKRELHTFEARQKEQKARDLREFMVYLLSNIKEREKIDQEKKR